MKNKTEQVEIMTKALISRCHGLYSQEALGNEIMDFADRVVKLLTTPDVSNLMPELEKVITRRIKDTFDNGMQNYEKNELLSALETIKRLVPPSYFEGICC